MPRGRWRCTERSCHSLSSSTSGPCAGPRSSRYIAIIEVNIASIEVNSASIEVNVAIIEVNIAVTEISIDLFGANIAYYGG